MAITEKTVEINGVNYHIQAFVATKGIRLFNKLVKLIGPSFRVIASSDGQDDAVAKAMTLLMENMDQVEMDKFLPELVSGVTKEGHTLSFETEFMADYGKLIKLAQEVISLNWGSIFQVLGTEEK